MATVAGGGELEFFRQLYRDHARPLYAYAYGFTSDPERAAEVVQDVMLRAWAQLPKLRRDDSSPRAWLFTVARNLCTDVHRAKAARRETLADDETLAAAAGVEDDIVERLVEVWNLKEALARLSPERRTVIDQIFYEGLAKPEIAQRLGIPTGTVSSRTFHALRQLRAMLTQTHAPRAGARPEPARARGGKSVGDEPNCRQYRELAAELALGILPASRRRIAQRHLDRCSRCVAITRELTRTVERLLELVPPTQPPAGFEQRVLAALAPPARRLRTPFAAIPPLNMHA